MFNGTLKIVFFSVISRRCLKSVIGLINSSPLIKPIQVQFKFTEA